MSNLPPPPLPLGDWPYGPAFNPGGADWEDAYRERSSLPVHETRSLSVDVSSLATAAATAATASHPGGAAKPRWLAKFEGLLQRLLEPATEGEFYRDAILLAARVGDLEAIKGCIVAGIGMNVQGEFGATPLHLAVKNARMKVVRYLVPHPKCRLDTQDLLGRTAVMIAMECGHVEEAVFLLEHGASVDLEALDPKMKHSAVARALEKIVEGAIRGGVRMGLKRALSTALLEDIIAIIIRYALPPSSYD